MRNKIIAIGILAMIAVCATLAMAASTPTHISISTNATDDTVAPKIVFINFTSGDNWTMEIENIEKSIQQTENGTINYDTNTNSRSNYVTFGDCGNITVGNNGKCVILTIGDYNVTTFVNNSYDVEICNVTGLINVH